MMPTTATPTQKNKPRINIRIDASLMKKLDRWASDAGISRSSAVSELLSIGMDSDTAGLESALSMQQQIRKEISSMRALIAESVTSSDTTAALHLSQMADSGAIAHDQIIAVFIKARQIARAKLKSAKKSS